MNLLSPLHFLILLAVFVFASGCSNNKESNEYLAKGIESIHSKDFNSAIITLTKSMCASAGYVDAWKNRYGACTYLNWFEWCATSDVG